MTTGELIKKIIKQRGLTQKKVAELSDCPAPTVGKIINNKVRGGDAYNRVCQTLAIPPQVISFKTLDPDEIVNESQRELLKDALPGINGKLDLIFDCKIQDDEK